MPGTSLLYSRGDHVHPSDPTRAALTQAVRYDAAQTLTGAQRSQARANIDVTKRNYIINGAAQINQGGYVSGAVLAAGAYGHDQWKAGAGGGDYSFTQSTGITTITIAAGKSLIQPIEDMRVTGGGNYVLAWTGTAQARAGVNTLTPSGAYAASPLLITGQTDGTVMSVEFNTGTLGSVSLTEGTVAPPFQVPDYASELALCRRYFYNGVPPMIGSSNVTTLSRLKCRHPTPMRTSPTLNMTSALSVYNSVALSTIASIGTSYSTVDVLEIDGTATASMSPTAGLATGVMQGQGGNLNVSARL